MKRNLFLQLSVLVVLIACLSACSKKTEYSNVIPLNTSELASINIKSLIEKAGINDKENKESLKKLTDAMKSGMNAATYQQLEALMKDPSKSGIDFSKPIYIFSAPTFNYITIVAKILNQDNLKKVIEVAQKEQLISPIAEGEGFSFANLNNEVLLAFNSNTFLAVNYGSSSELEKAKEGITVLMKQTEDNSINKSPAFKKMQKMDGDINMFISPSSLLGTYAKQLNYGLAQDIDLKDLTLLGGLVFEKGKIELRIENYTENAKLEALLKKQEKSTCPLENTFLKYFPKSTISLFSIGINGEEIYNLLQENEHFRNEFSITKANEVKELFSTFQNDLTIGLINVTLSNAPTFLAYASVKNESSLKALYDKKGELKMEKGEDIVKLNENEYVFKSRDINIFFGVRNKQMYATNDELLYKNIFRAVEPSVKETNYASELKGNRMAFVISAEAILELPLIKMMVEYGGAEYNTYYSLGKNISYLKTTSDGNQVAVTLQLKDKNINALKQIVNFIKEFTGI